MQEISGDLQAQAAHLQALSDSDVMRLLAAVTAETLALGTDLVDALGTAMNVDVSKTWTPDGTFFELIRDKQVLNEMLAEVIGKTHTTLASRRRLSSGRVS